MFGYGSLVSPTSFGGTLGRQLQLGVDVLEAEVNGFGRRWNYGVMHTRGLTDGPDGPKEWTIVALGVVPSASETVNGVIGWVGEHELAGLDRRERHYDRVDVSHLVNVPDWRGPDAPVVTYVPRVEARRHYEAARDDGRAAIEQRYWNLVDTAFAALGPDRHERYHATTPSPDIPVVEMRREP